MYVSGMGTDLHIIDLYSYAVNTILVGPAPGYRYSAYSNGKLYVLNNNSVSIVDTNTDTVIGTIP